MIQLTVYKPNKYQIHGVTRLLKSTLLSQYLHTVEYVQKFIVTTEKRGTDKEHVHFYLESQDRKCNIHRFRQDAKAEFKFPASLKNGDFNLDKRVKDPLQNIIYLCKEGYPEHVHGFSVAFMKECTRSSYNPNVTMTTQLKNNLELFLKGQIEMDEYLLQYRHIRCGARKPDPNWHKQYYNALEQTTSEEDKKTQIRELISLGI